MKKHLVQTVLIHVTIRVKQQQKGKIKNHLF